MANVTRTITEFDTGEHIVEDANGKIVAGVALLSSGKAAAEYERKRRLEHSQAEYVQCLVLLTQVCEHYLQHKKAVDVGISIKQGFSKRAASIRASEAKRSQATLTITPCIKPQLQEPYFSKLEGEIRTAIEKRLQPTSFNLHTEADGRFVADLNYEKPKPVDYR